jgi:Flp pilus assembly protein protease CpaA
LAVALAYALGQGLWLHGASAGAMLIVYRVVGGRLNILGGGDYKLLAVLCAALGPAASCWALGVGGVFCLPLWAFMALKNPKAPVPLGVPLILGAVASLYIRVDWFL